MRAQASAQMQSLLSRARRLGEQALTKEELQELEAYREQVTTVGEGAAQSLLEAEEETREKKKLRESEAAAEAAVPPEPLKKFVRTRLGMRGPAVAKWQKFLLDEGYDLGDEAKGDERTRLHGTKTEDASLDWDKKPAKAAKNPRARRVGSPYNPIKLLFAANIMRAACRR